MKASARFQQDDAYFEQLYEEWLRYGSRVRRWQPWVAIVLGGLGVALFLLAPYLKVSSSLLVVFALLQFVENHFYRRKWVRERVAARRNNEHNEIFLEFDENGIVHKGPNSSGVIKWSAIVGLRESPRGLSLTVGDEVSIYIPKAAIEPLEAVSEIVKYSRRGA